MRTGVAAGVLAVAATCLAGCSGQTDLSAVAVTCARAINRAMGAQGGEYTSGDFLAFHHGALRVSSPVRGQLGTAMTGVGVGCVLKETEAPASVEAQLREGTVRDGRQEVTWNDVTMSYRFLADKGLQAVVRLT